MNGIICTTILFCYIFSRRCRFCRNPQWRRLPQRVVTGLWSFRLAMQICRDRHALRHLTPHRRTSHIALQKRANEPAILAAFRTRPEVEMTMSTKTFDSALDFVPKKPARKGGVWSSVVDAFV